MKRIIIAFAVCSFCAALFQTPELQAQCNLYDRHKSKRGVPKRKKVAPAPTPSRDEDVEEDEQSEDQES
jgi:hypothetical protein